MSGQESRAENRAARHGKRPCSRRGRRGEAVAALTARREWRFAYGVSGNPRGRLPGPRNRATEIGDVLGLHATRPTLDGVVEQIRLQILGKTTER
jgi:hypothetical protein